MSQNDTYYLHIESTLYLRTTIRNYNAGGYTSGTDIAVHMRMFRLTAYIFYLGNDIQII